MSPTEFVKDYKEIAGEISFLGKKLDRFNRDELLAISVYGFKMLESSREDHKHTLDMMKLLNQTKRKWL